MDNKHNLHIRPISELHHSVQSLIGVARRKGEPEIQDINGRNIVAEQLEEKWKRSFLTRNSENVARQS